jgi:hypothetical protein
MRLFGTCILALCLGECKLLADDDDERCAVMRKANGG